MKNEEIKRGYRNDEGVWIADKLPKNKMRCHWSTDGYDCEYLATPDGYIWCEKHAKIMHKINGRKFNINPQVKEALMRNE